MNTKVAGVAGVVWAAANAVIGFSTGQPPSLDAPGEEIATYLADHRGIYLTAVGVFAGTLPLLFMFASALVRRAGERRGSVWTPTIPPALATLAVGTFIAYVVLLPFLLVDGLGSEAPDGLIRYAYVLTFAVTMIGNIGGAVLIAAVGLTQSRRARIASLGIAGLIAAGGVAGLVSADVAVIGGMGFLAIATWSIVVGVGMVREAGALSHSSVPNAATA